MSRDAIRVKYRTVTEFAPHTELAFAALIGDVVGSRESPNRSDLQRRLRREIDGLNARLGSALASDLALQKGDEIQVLPSAPDLAVDIVVRLSEAIFPEIIVFGLGYGSLSTDLSNDVGQIDGPCFHRAREALDVAKAGSWLVARGFGERTDTTLTALFTLMGAIRRRWTEKQLTYSRMARSQAQNEVARHFHVSPSTVSESLKASAWAAVVEGEEAAKRLLTEFGYNTESELNSPNQPK